MRQPQGDPHLWAAKQLYNVIGLGGRRKVDRFDQGLQELVHSQQALITSCRRNDKARSRQWFLAAAQERHRIVDLIVHFRRQIDGLLRQEQPHFEPPLPLSLRSILQEVRQLESEFNEVLIEPQRSLIAVVTKPVTLRGVHLGPFQIELYLDRLAERFDANAIDCVALDPNPATSCEEVTHPHVKSNALCTGEATLPIQAALREGRICDLFLLINSVLNTYNGGSPYVSLDDWNGIACGDCGFSCDRDDLYGCQGCECDYCGSCISSCEGCEESYCRGCLEREGGDGRYLCGSCRAICPRCGLVASAPDVDEYGMCHSCHEDQQEQSQHEEFDHDDDHQDSSQDAGAQDPAQPNAA
jgi:hypothetical protein